MAYLFILVGVGQMFLGSFRLNVRRAYLLKTGRRVRSRSRAGGVLLHDLKQADPFMANAAEDNTEAVNDLFALAKADAEGGFPEWILELARSQKDAPGCSDLAARV